MRLPALSTGPNPDPGHDSGGPKAAFRDAGLYTENFALHLCRLTRATVVFARFRRFGPTARQPWFGAELHPFLVKVGPI